MLPFHTQCILHCLLAAFPVTVPLSMGAPTYQFVSPLHLSHRAQNTWSQLGKKQLNAKFSPDVSRWNSSVLRLESVPMGSRSTCCIHGKQTNKTNKQNLECKLPYCSIKGPKQQKPSQPCELSSPQETPDLGFAAGQPIHSNGKPA